MVTQALINSQENYNYVLASNFVGSGGTIIIPANFWVFSTSTALTVDVDDVTIENYGKIVGRARGISIGASGATINNYSGAFIAGGGGNGSQGRNGAVGQGAGSSDPMTVVAPLMAAAVAAVGVLVEVMQVWVVLGRLLVPLYHPAAATLTP